jgi:hypothetical protein
MVKYFMIEKLPLFSILSMGIISTFCFLSFLLTYSSYKKIKNSLLFYFSLLFLGLGLMHLLLTIGAFLASFNSQLAGIFYLIAHWILFFTIATFINFPISLYSTRLMKIFLTIFLLLASISSFLISFNIPSPTVSSSNLVFWNVPFTTSKIIGSYAAILFILTTLLFFFSFIKAAEKIYKLRFLMFILGFLIFLIAGPSHNFAKNEIQYFLADFLTPLGSLVILLGIYLPRIFRKAP